MNARRAPWETLGVATAGIVGVIDATIGRSADLAVVFGAIVVLALVASLRAMTNRRRIPLRADLVAWLEQTALEEGTTVEEVADSTIALARAGIAGRKPPGAARP